MQPGIYRDLPNEAYHAAKGISKSGLDDVALSPAIYKIKREQREKDTGKRKKCFTVGTAAHVAVLEPDAFDLRYHVAKIARTSRIAWGDLEKANPEKEVITTPEYDDFMRMQEAVRKHPRAAEILAKGYSETSIFQTDPITGELVKVRPDWFVEDILADFKTDRAADPESFARSCFNYRYFVQAPFYMDVAGAGLKRTFNDFVFIVVEKETYEVAVYYADKTMLDIGRAEYRRNLDLYASCRKSGIWSGYNDGEISPISLPTWASRRLSAIHEQTF